MTESVVEFCSLGNAPETVDEYSKPIKDFLQNACALLKDLSRQDHKTQTKKKAAVAQACLDAYHDGNVFSRLEALLAAVPDRAAAVASSSNDPFYRCAELHGRQVHVLRGCNAPEHARAVSSEMWYRMLLHK